MKKNFLIRAFLGVTIVSLGGILLLRNLGVITFDNWPLFWGTFWAGIFLIAGLSILFSSRRPTGWVWGLLLVAVAAVVALNAYNIINISVWKLFWPMILILVGLAVVLGIGSGRRQSKKRAADGDDSEKVAIFYSEESRVKGDYTGGSLTAIFGGVELDLRQAKIKDGAVIDVFALCGGISISLPDDVIIQNEVRGILGGREDKTAPKSSAKKTIYLRGECILGGLEVK